ncbi:LuxR C-terminal-related transcriptional regulator [Cupriavidus basilensis]|uniref:LuxR C-terminal-related transcriptional regulator n=1 Tax=Cupriavidus basilensis TaxID=68895 RepID=A0ABT6ATQ0_9BURK|nr:LuxR C-terminal-related transcriptional regulator [Cupriavidus basilensis]MDF3835997.1 LuxR C-terminal-related transcriptional regulator [Cupriavidus basilensis]
MSSPDLSLGAAIPADAPSALATLLGDIDRAQDIDGLAGAVCTAARLLGFNHFYLRYKGPPGSAPPQPASLTSLPGGASLAPEAHGEALAALVVKARDSLVPVVCSSGQPLLLPASDSVARAELDRRLTAAIAFSASMPSREVGTLALLSLDGMPGDDEAAICRARLFGPALTQSVLDRFCALVRGPSVPEAALTARELEVLRWVAQGKTSWEAGQILGISEHGISHHMRNVMRKLGVGNRLQAVRTAIAMGLLPG